MKSFDYVRAGSAADAAGLLAETRTALLKAAGTDLLDRLKSQLETPTRLVSLAGAPGMDAISRDGGGARIGALATLARIAAEFREGPLAVLGQAAGAAATPQVRNVATLGGNLLQRPRCAYYRLAEVSCLKKGGSTCPAAEGDHRLHAVFATSPCSAVHPSNLAVALSALGAVVQLQGPKGAREVPMASFFTAAKDDPTRENVVQRDEVLASVTVPAPAEGSRSAYLEAREKESFDWALVSAAVVLALEGGTIKSARVVLGSVSGTPWRSEAAEAALAGKKAGEESAAAAGKAAFEAATPLPGSAWKVRIGRTIVKRAVLAAAGLWKE